MIGRYLHRFVCLLVFTLAPLALAGADDRPDYGFEAVSKHGGLIDWKGSSTYPLEAVEVVTDDPRWVRNGNHAVRLIAPAASADKPEQSHFYCRTTVPIKSGDAPYTLSLWSLGKGKVTGTLYLHKMTDNGETFLKSINLKSQSDAEQGAAAQDWTQHQFVATADMIPDEAVTARVVLRVSGAVVVDDIRFGDEASLKKSESAASGQSVRPNLLTVGTTGKAPELDGRIASHEYATLATGLLDNSTRNLYPYDNRFAFSADDKRFYFAIEVQLPVGYELKGGGGKNDDASLIAGTDTFYMMIRPDDDTDAMGYEGLYLGVSSSGTVYDAWEKVDWAKGFVDRNASFDAGVKAVSQARDGRWVVELSLDRKALERGRGGSDKPFAMSFGMRLTEHTPTWQLHASWFDHPQAFGQLQLSTDALEVSVDALGELIRGQVEPRVHLHNPTSQPHEYQVQCLIATPRMVAGEAGTYIFDVQYGETIAEAVLDQLVYQWKDQGELGPGDTRSLKDAGELDTPQAQVMEIDVRSSDGPLFYQKLPFRYEPAVTAELTPHPRDGVLLADVSFRGAQEADRGRVRVEVFGEPGEPLWETTEDISSEQVSFDIPLDAMEPGEYNIRFVLKGAENKEIGVADKLFVKPPAPDWLTDPKGIAALQPDWAPRPWGPMKATDTTVEVWGRQFSFSNRGLLAGITSQGREILTQPMTVHYRNAQGDQQFTYQNATRTETHEGRVVFEQSAESSAFTLSCRQQIEFDGMDRFDITVTPRKPTEVQGMWIDLPLADLPYSTMTALDNFWQHGEATESLFETPRSYTVVWLGDEEVGCAFFAENYRGWLVDSSKPRVTLHDTEGGRVLRLHLANVSVRVDEPMVLTFGLHPTPIKPLFKGWRGLRPQGLAITPPPTNLVMLHSDYWGASDYNPIPRTWEVFEDAVDYLHERGQKMYPYLTGFSVSPYYKISDEWDFEPNPKRIPDEYYLQKKTPDNRNETYFYYAHDWQLNPPRVNRQPVETREEARVSPSSSWTDYFVGGIHEMLERTDLDGLYIDIHRPSLNYDPEKNLTHTTLDGVNEGSIELFATRDFYKRLYQVFLEHRDDSTRPWLMGHGFGASVPYVAFWDINFNGEEIKPTAPFEFTKLNLQKSMVGSPLAKVEPGPESRDYDALSYRAVFVNQFGSATMYLPQYGYLPELKTVAHAREVLSFTFLHNNLLWPAYLAAEPVYKFWSDVEVPYDMTHTVHHPYWSNEVQSSPDSIKVSFWTKPDSDDTLIAVANWSSQPTDAKIKLPGALPLTVTGVDMESGEQVNLNEGGMTLTIPALDLRVLRFNADAAPE